MPAMPAADAFGQLCLVYFCRLNSNRNQSKRSSGNALLLDQTSPPTCLACLENSGDKRGRLSLIDNSAFR